MSDSPPEQLSPRLGYEFYRPEWLQEALTHKSYLNESRGKAGGDNERLEFLGDAVLDLVISEYLLVVYPGCAEGDLSKMKSRIVSEESLAEIARRLDLGRFLRLGRGEELTGGRDKPSLLSDSLEAVIAAVYLDGQIEAARRVVLALCQPELAGLGDPRGLHDHKTELQELCQRRFGILPSYRIVGESGPDHQKLFEVELAIRGEGYGVGRGRSKKEAEQRAAQVALDRLLANT